MVIVCSEYSLQIQPETSSVEEEVVLFLDKITNFPRYTTGTEEDVGANLIGPYAGGDIAVHLLTRAGVLGIVEVEDESGETLASMSSKEGLHG